MSKRAGIAGAGLAGRLLAFELLERGWDVTLFDSDTEEGARSTTYASAGMLSPYCELEKAETEISFFGLQSIPLWKNILERLDSDVYQLHRGSLVVAHPQDALELDSLRKKIEERTPDKDLIEVADAARIGELEPELAGRFHRGLFFSAEANLDNRGVLDALRARLHEKGVTWHTNTPVSTVAPRTLTTDGDTLRFDWAIDCRGIGARDELENLRGVRGELVYVHAPEVELSRPVRLMHPRYPIYIVPRRDDMYLIGATAIESDDMGAITVRSALELLTAAYTVHTGFAEARLVETVTHCRPAFPDNRPRIYHGDGILRVNGLYRHGFLIAPSLIQFAVEFLERGAINEHAASVMEEI
ncbi:MAG: glycine oxidase ThiO [Verrucomicrobia bacterium]|nr:glycine oxidase ThiO [Verrucomicrobiota bacterium]